MKPIIHLSIGVAAGAAIVLGATLLMPRASREQPADSLPRATVGKPAQAEAARPALPAAKQQPPMAAPPAQESQIAYGTMPAAGGALNQGPAKNIASLSPARSSAPDRTAPSAKPKSTPLVNPAAYSTAPQTSGPYGTSGAPGMIEVMVPNAMPGESAAMLPASLVEPGQDLPKETRAGIDSLAKDFSEDVNATSPSPDDPQYRQAWDEAQALNDILFKTRYGGQAFRAQHLKAAQEANAQAE